MNKSKNFDSSNILEIIDTKLQTFRRKKQLLQEKVSSQTEEIEHIKKNISELQKKLQDTTENIESSNKEIVELDRTIDELDTGYKNIIESGQTLMALVEKDSD